MTEITEWEDFERDKLARYLIENLTVIEREQWLTNCYFSELSADMAKRIKEQPLERDADRYIVQSSTKQIETWIEAMGYEKERQACRRRLNRARLRLKAIKSE